MGGARGCRVPAHQWSSIAKRNIEKSSPASIDTSDTWVRSDGLRYGEGFEGSFWRTSFVLLLLSPHLVIFAFREYRRTLVPPMQPLSAASSLPNRVFWTFICPKFLRPPSPVRWCSFILEAQLLVPVWNCPQPMIFYCKKWILQLCNILLPSKTRISWAAFTATQEAGQALSGENVSSGQFFIHSSLLTAPSAQVSWALWGCCASWGLPPHRGLGTFSIYPLSSWRQKRRRGSNASAKWFLEWMQTLWVGSSVWSECSLSPALFLCSAPALLRSAQAHDWLCAVTARITVS